MELQEEFLKRDQKYLLDAAIQQRNKPKEELLKNMIDSTEDEDDFQLPPELDIQDVPVDVMETLQPQHTEDEATRKQQGDYKRERKKFHIRKANIGTIPPEMQADTGANCTATNDRSILWNVRYLNTPIPIVTYDEKSNDDTACYATAIGTIKIITESNDILDITALYCPRSTGTVISPHKIMMDEQVNGAYGFRQDCNIRGNGVIEIYDKMQKTIARMKLTSEKNGIYTVTNNILKPLHEEGPSIKMTIADEAMIEHSIRTTKTVVETIESDTTVKRTREDAIALLPEMDIENQAKVHTTVTPRIDSTTATPRKPTKVKQYDMELWHQRYCHCGANTLLQTRQHVDGIPPLPSSTSDFHCPFCDMSKLVKSKGRKETKREHISPGTAFHMDLAFVSGPSNLKDVVEKGATPATTVKKSYDGFVAYLLIVDAATRYAWVFLLKTKHPPIEIIDTFLQQHGKAKSSERVIISTSKCGALASSQKFEQTCANHHYTVENHDYNLGLDLPSYVVKTDNGTELAASEAFRSTCQRHQYNVETTAPDMSSQNGKAERPHRTLKERVRCMLYAAGLPIDFWSDAILHAIWLYNRTYHTAISTVPYKAWTGRRPTVDGLLTFGCKVTSRRSRNRTTAGDPNSYDGIFLGYRGTMDNIKFWNIHTKQKLTTRHKTVDELEYGRKPADRAPASKHLLQHRFGESHQDLRTDKLHEKPISLDPKIPMVPAELNAEPTAAAAAKTIINSALRPTTEELQLGLQLMEISTNLHEKTVVETIPNHSQHETLGMIVQAHPDLKQSIQFLRCENGSVAAKTIRRWKSRLKGATIIQIDDTHISTVEDIKHAIALSRKSSKQHVKVHFAQPNWSAHNGNGIPMLHFDQLNVIAHHIHTIKTGEDLWKNKNQWPEMTDDLIDAAVNKGIAIPKWTRRKCQASEYAKQFLESEWSQLNKYDKQGMFGEPTTRPIGATVLPWVWTYVMKEEQNTGIFKPKSRGTCNGGKRYGQAVTLAETYAACLEQPAHRLAWALTASLNYICKGCDVANAFAEADGPEAPFYMIVDEQFQQWWTEHLKRPPIQRGYVIPIKKNLQGHPEAPRLWSKHMDKIMKDELGFKATTHEPCLYFKHKQMPSTTLPTIQEDDEQLHSNLTRLENQLILVLRQVDDFLISAKDSKCALEVIQDIQSHMTNTLNDLGTVSKFNGVEIDQTMHYVKVHCTSYIDKIVKHHGWENELAATLPVPMRTDPAYIRELEAAIGPEDATEAQDLETQMGFSYRQAIGELIYAMTICRIDISSAVIKLSQYSDNPSKCHYQAVRAVFIYLNATKSDGIYYWRPRPNLELPFKPLPKPITKHEILDAFPRETNETIMHGYSDATWGTDRQHRRSVSGIVFLLAGGAIYYRTRIQPTIALSSTEAEASAMADAGKVALYLRSILEEIQMEQIAPTPIRIDNRGALLLSNAQQPSTRTRHIELKEMAFMQWTEEEKLEFVDTRTQYNISDGLSKPLGRIKHYEQHDITMGRRQPHYIQNMAKPP